MDDDKIIYRYSLSNCLLYSFFAGWIIFILIMFIFLPPLHNHNMNGMATGGFIILIPVIYLLRVTMRYTIPALKGKTALEINRTGVINYAKHSIIEWTDITDLRMSENNGVGVIHFYYKETDGSENFLRTHLMWINGDAKEIYGILATNLEDRNTKWRTGNT